MSRTYHRRCRVTRTFCSGFCAGSVQPAPRGRAVGARPEAGHGRRASSSGCRPKAPIPRPIAAYRATYDDARARVKRLTGARKVQLGGVVTDLEGMAARKQFTLSRLPSLFLTLQRNVEWWTTQRAAQQRRAGRLHRLRARLPVLSRPRHPDPVARHVRQAQRLLERRQALRRQSVRAPGRDQDAVRPARRRPRVGVPVPVRRPAAAVGLLARPGHRAAGDGPQRHAPEPPGGRVPGRPRRARHLPDRAAGRRARSPPAPAPTTCSTPACRSFKVAQRLHPVAQRALRLRDPHRRPDRAVPVRGRRPRRPRRGRHVRHGRLEPLQPRRADHPRVRPRLPQAPDRLPQGAVRPHDGDRVLREPSSASTSTWSRRRSCGRSPAGRPRASKGTSASGSPRSRA